MNFKITYWVTVVCAVSFFSGVFNTYYYELDGYLLLTHVQFGMSVFAALVYQVLAKKHALNRIIVVSIFFGFLTFVSAYTLQEIYHTGVAVIPFTSNWNRFVGRALVLTLLMPMLYVNLAIGIFAYFLFRKDSDL